MNKRGLTHRDIKLENILIKSLEPFKVVLTDFGTVAHTNNLLNHPGPVSGTSAYWAPEVSDEGRYSPLSDSFALGLVAFALLVGETPRTFYGKCETGQRKMLWTRLSNFSSEAVDFIKRMTDSNLSVRISCAEALEHPWLTGETLLYVPEKFMLTCTTPCPSAKISPVLVDATTRSSSTKVKKRSRCGSDSQPHQPAKRARIGLEKRKQCRYGTYP